MISRKTLDLTAGNLIFAVGIYDLRNNIFTPGFKPEDFISFTLSRNYLSLTRDAVKAAYVRSE
jgi:hypothetical protein